MKILNKEKGFTGIDIAISIGLITLFTGVIATISYNIFLANSSAKMISRANSYIVDIFETVDMFYYDDIDEQKLVQYFNNKYSTNPIAKAKASGSSEEIKTTYAVEIKVETYTPTDIDKPKLDLVKEVTIKVAYRIGNKNQTLTMSRVKAREISTLPI